MKRLSQQSSQLHKPEGPLPEVYQQKDMNEVSLEEKQEPEKTDIPPKVLFNYDLKHLKSFKKIRQKYKLKNMQHVFLSDLSIVLDEYSPNDSENELNDELLLEILNITEDYFFYPCNKQEREEVKRDCVMKLMLPYFRNDAKLLEKTIGHIYHKVKKSTFKKRLYQRMKYFFLKK